VRNSENSTSLSRERSQGIERIDESLRACDDLRAIYKDLGCATPEDAAKKLAKHLALMQLVVADITEFDEFLRPVLLDTDSAACSTNKSRTVAPSLVGAAQFTRLVRKLVDTQNRLADLPEQDSKRDVQDEKEKKMGSSGSKTKDAKPGSSAGLEKRLAEAEAALKESEAKLQTAEAALENTNATSESVAPEVLKDAFDQLIRTKQEANAAHHKYGKLERAAAQVVALLEQVGKGEAGGNDSAPAAGQTPPLPPVQVAQLLLSTTQAHVTKLQKQRKSWVAQEKQRRQDDQRRQEDQRRKEEQRQREQQQQVALSQQEEAEALKQGARCEEQRRELRDLRAKVRKLERQMLQQPEQHLQRPAVEGNADEGTDPCKARIEALQAEHTCELTALQRVVDEREMQIAMLRVRASGLQMRRDMRSRVDDEPD
jgi:hypothetical protein